MPLFFHKTFESEKNGTISVTRFFGSTDVMVGGCYQSGRYIDRLFAKLLKLIPHAHPVKEVLLLGLGGGGAIREVKKHFRDAHVTAVEYDPIMVEIAKTIYLKPEDFLDVQIILGDAGEAVSQMTKKFDVVIVDLFFGQELSPHLSHDDFIESLTHRLSPDGYLAVNFFRQMDAVAPLFDRFFSRWNDMWFSSNRMALYRHFGQGLVGDPLPDGYVDRQQSKTDLDIPLIIEQKKEIIGTPGCLGVRRKIGPLFVEAYSSDIEPVIQPFDHPRIIFWQPLTTGSRRGWYRNVFSSRRYQHGVGIVRSENLDGYRAHWSAHARRHLEKWSHDIRYEITDVSLEAFVQAYHASKKLDWLTRKMFVHLLNIHHKHHPDHLRLFGARDVQTGHIMAGLAVVEYPDIIQSFHLVSFLHDSVRKTSVGVGLIAHWYGRGIESGIRFFNFGIVWRRGDPRAYKGYSKFKRQFDLCLVIYPRPLFKFVAGQRNEPSR